MIAQVTAAALVSENKTLGAPASVDWIPTSANQEDHVSMATYAARRLLRMVDNAAAVVGIELLAAARASNSIAPPNPPAASKRFMRASAATSSFIQPIDTSHPISMSRVLG